MKVLTLDDMQDRQRTFAIWYAGFDLVQVGTAPEAIAALAKERFDIVQLDHDLAEEHYLILSEGLLEGPVQGEAKYLPGTGMDVVDFITDMPDDKKPKLVIVHSWNFARSLEMLRRLEEHRVKAFLWKFDPKTPTPWLLTRFGLW